MENSDLSDTFYLPPVTLALSKDKLSSIFGKEPTVAITGWGHYRTDVPGMQDTTKPAIRNYSVIATSIKTFGAAPTIRPTSVSPLGALGKTDFRQGGDAAAPNQRRPKNG